MDRAEVSTAPRIFLFSGEGAHSSETDTAFLKLSKSWSVVEDALHKLGFPDTETFLLQNLGKHHAPTSPVVSVVLNILNADLWQQWGEVPSIVLGHSVGEIAAAYVAGIFTVDEAISCAHSLGLAMLDMPGSKGVMLHTELQRKFLHTMEDVHLAAVNFVIQKGPTEQEDLLSVTLCSLGSAEAYLAQDPKATLLKPQHAWHHPACKLPASPVQPLPRGQHSSGPLFISAVTATQLDELPEDHWQRWCCCPVNFAAALEVAKNMLRGASPVVLEMGPHPVLFQAAKASFDLAGYACSMRRGEKQGPFLRSQRALVPGFGLKLRNVLSSQLKTWKLAKPLADDLEITFADQGLASQHLVPLTQELRNFFPTLAVHDLYRFNSVEELIQRWDAGVTASHTWTAHASSGLDILGCGVRLPAGVNSPGAFWALLEEDDQSSAFSSKAGFKAAFLEPKFDHKAALVAAEESGLEGAEAAALDPQHALALQLAKEMFHDADPAAVKLLQTRPERVGVYIGAWQEVSISTKTSAFHAIGASLSALAARVANTYDLQGPAVTINTACSSALVAVHEAMKDAKTGRIDFAIVGGVNLFGEDLQLFHHLRRAAMLSPSGKCHTFSAEADGYVRAEGGVLFLLAREDLELPSHGCILGSAVTQNSRRKPLSSVDPTAQERAICLACEDAGLQSSELAAVELHGTGTPLGDPVEVSALARAIRDGAGCKMTAAKMHVGHLESAAGAVGLLKAMLMCQHHKVPAFQIDGNSLNQQVMAALEGSCLCQPGDEGLLMDNAKVGISSFGFAGSNAHVVMMAAKKCPAEKYAVPVPVQKTMEPPVKQLEMLSSTMSPRCSASSETYYADTIPKQKDGADVEDVDIVTCLSFVSSAVLSIVGGGVEVDVDADLHELGLDSLGLAELLGLLEDKYGAGCISVEKIMEEPACRAIAAMLEGCEIVAKSLPPPVLPVVKVAPLIHAKTSPATEHVAQSDANVDHVDGFHSVDHHGWIRTTHVGSLPRPADGTLDLNQVIAQQADCVDIINDGEWGRENYIADVINRVSGLQSGDKTEPQTACCAKHAMPLASDMQDVPIYAQRFSGGNGLITLNPKRPAVSGLACVDHPKYTPGNMASLQAFLTAVSAAGKPVSDCFYSVPSPGTMALFCRDFVFNDHAAYVMALADALAEEYQQIAQHGLQLQVDCPDLAMGRHTKWSDLSEKDFLDVARCNVAALNQALQHVPVEQVRVHICWGNYAGPHHQDMSAELLWPLLGEVKAKYLLMEGANPRHRADVQCFEEAVKKGYFKSHQVIVPGLIDTTTARVEDPRLIAESLLRYARAAGHPARVIASTDCGFASTARSTAITADLAWMKLQSLKAGAQLATRSFLEQQAPVLCRSIALTSTPFRPVIFSSQEPSVVSFASKLCKALDRAAGASVHPALHFTEPEAACEALRWMVDVPSAFVVLGESMALAEAARTQLEAVGTVSRRPATLCCFSVFEEIAHVVEEVRRTALSQTSFDKRCLVLPRSKVPPVVDVVVVGAGLLGMLTAHRCTSAGFSVAVLEQRPVIGGIWSMYANSTSQVNSSEGGYCIKDILGEDGETEFDNRDHSTAAEILKDLAKLGDCLQQHIFTSVKVMKILGEGGNYTVLFQDELALRAGILQCRGVVLCVNDRVGLPRPLNVPGQDSFLGVVADGTSDSLAGTDWRGKRVVIAGMGAFAVENVRTALEHGASEVTVVARRHGTICPKAIDYLNFVKPWDEKYKHDTQTNVKQFLRWKQLYEASGCQVPECWPKQVKHDGHTISVSDIWFIAHHMKKLSTKTGVLQKIEREGVVLSTGDFVPCDVVVGCIGFERSNTLCETLTGRSEVKTTNYLDQDMMYLADAEIDEGAFNSFFGSSVLEYGKFFSNVFVEGLQRPDVLGEQLWGSLTTSVPISQRKWNQYIASAMKLIEVDHQISEHARHQVEARTKHFWRTLPPSSFLAVNRREWEEMHDRLNGGVPVPKEQQLPYFFEEIPAWC